MLDDGRVQCEMCPRFCRLKEGARGLCFVRARQDEAIVLTTYGRSSGFCVDPIEKTPLNNFRSEEQRVGKKCGSTGRTCWTQYEYNKNPTSNTSNLNRKI